MAKLSEENFGGELILCRPRGFQTCQKTRLIYVLGEELYILEPVYKRRLAFSTKRGQDNVINYNIFTYFGEKKPEAV